MAAGLGDDSIGHWFLVNDGINNMKPDTTGKPPYRVPSMVEIRDIPWNGFNVASTFSGTGGSCLGYRMAGFRVLWASEFVPAAQACYKLNHPDSILDTRDIRQVDAADILTAVGLKRGELDLLDGSPPCASFSTAGKRAAGWGEVKKYSDTKQRTDDLFFEFARILEGIQPKTVVAENVSGLVKGQAKGYFKLIMARMKDCGYRVSCRVLDAKWLGVPQSRQRTIFVGVRKDIDADPCHPEPLRYFYSVRDAIPLVSSITQDPKGQFAIQKIGPTDACFTIKASSASSISIDKYAISKEWDKLKPGESSDRYFNLVKPHPDNPCPTVTQCGGALSAASVTHPIERRKFTIDELKRICAFPDDFQLVGTYTQQWERLGRSVPPVMMSHIAATVRDRILIPCAD